MPHKKAPSLKAVKIKEPKIILTGGLIKQTLDIYRANWQKFGTLLIIPLTLSALSSLLFYLVRIFAADFSAPLLFALFFLFFIWMIINGILFVSAGIAQLLLVSDLKHSVQFGNLAQWLRRALALLWPALFVSVIYFIFMILGLIFLVIPGIMVMIYFCFAVYKVVLDGSDVEESFGQSRQLVRGYFWAVFGRLLLGCLLIWLIYLLVAAVFSLAGWLISYLPLLHLGKDLGALLYSVLGIFIGLVVGPLSIIYTYNIFKSLSAVKTK